MLLIAFMTALVAPPPAKVIVVTATAGYRHESIETAETVIASIGRSTRSFDPRFVRTEDELAALTPQDLADAAVVIFVNTTAELRWPDRRRLTDWVAAGGSFIGVHSASDTWHEWPEYIEMLGGEFDSHPPDAKVDVYVDDPDHPATRHIRSPLAILEEIYFFKSFDRDRVKVLLSLRAAPDDRRPGFFPLAWQKSYGEGSVFYTALGHRIDIWESEWFQQHLRGAIEAAVRRRLAKR